MRSGQPARFSSEMLVGSSMVQWEGQGLEPKGPQFFEPLSLSGKTQGPLEESPQHKLNKCLGLLPDTTRHPILSTHTWPPLTKHHFP